MALVLHKQGFFRIYLSVHLSRFTEALNVDEMVRAPLPAVVVELPLLKHVEQRQMIALGDEELFPRRI